MRAAIETNNISAVVSLATDENINRTEFYVEELDAMLNPLQLAAYHGHSVIVYILIHKKADINAITVDEEGFFQRMGRYFSLGIWRREGRFTALHLAGRADHSLAIRALLVYGADYQIRDNRGQLALTASQLCRNFPVSDQLTCLDLSIYGEFKPEYIDLIKVAFAAGGVKKIKIKFPNIDLGGFFGRELSANERLVLFLTLINVLKTNQHLSEIILDVNYHINTSSVYLDPNFVVLIRKVMIQILNSLLELRSLEAIEHLSLGVLKHIHTVEGINQTTKTTTTILKICDSFMHEISAYPESAKEYLDDCNDSIMGVADLLARIFSTAEDRLTKKILDSEIIIAFCTKLSEFLQRKQVLLVPLSSIEPLSAMEVDLPSVSEAAGVGVGATIPAVTPSVATNAHGLFNARNSSAAGTELSEAQKECLWRLELCL